MTTSRPNARRRRAAPLWPGPWRRGLTLFEVLLVLALLVVIAAMAWPIMQGPLRSQRLRRAADLVRAKFDRARVDAMRTGRIHVFLHVPGGDTYVVRPWQGIDDEVEASLDARLADVQQTQLDPGLILQRLPDGVTFVATQAEIDARGAILTESLTGAIPAADGDGWAPPIVFYPDGVVSEAQLILATEQGEAIAIHLRGMTGITRVGDIYLLEGFEP